MENNIQKFKWTKHKIYEDYSDANNERDRLLSENSQFVKIRRCGDGGSRFKVVIGKLLQDKKVSKKRGNNK